MNESSANTVGLMFDVDADNLRAEVLEGSLSAPVILIFWAESSDTCQTQMATLAKLVQEYAGKFRVGRLNAGDSNPNTQMLVQQLSGQLGVQTIPAMVLIHEGKPVQVLQGLQGEAELKPLLNELTMSSAERIKEQLDALIATGEQEQALVLLQQILTEEPDNTALQVMQATLLLQLGRIEDARMLVNALPDDAPGLLQPRAKLAFLDMAEDLEPRSVITQRVAEQPGDLEALYQLAIHHVLADDEAAACEILLTIISRDRTFRDDGARLLMLKIFEQKGSDPMVRRYRNRLFSLMH